VLYTLDEVVDGKVRYTATHQLVFNADNDWTDVTLAVEGPDALDGQVNQVVRRTPGEISAGWLRGELPVSTGGWLPGGHDRPVPRAGGRRAVGSAAPG
jgi:hypothetical protein